jgi:hypothetical protein
LSVLLCLAVAIHGWLFAHTYLPSRDTVGYIRYALSLENHPWTEAIPRMEQHPLYPVSVWLFSVPIRAVLGGTTAHTMTWSAQAASVLAAVLLVIPLFYLGRELFNRRVGFWSTALFQLLPISAQVTSDGLSDSLFLLLASTALWLACRALRIRSPWGFAGCGLCAGLAYLTRPEGALIAGAAVLTLLGLQALPWQRWPWGKSAACAGALTAAFFLVAAPYMAVIGGITVKPTPQLMLGLSDATPSRPPATGQSHALLPPGSKSGPPLAVWWNDQKKGNSAPLRWAVWALGREVVRTSQYVLWLPALLGFWWYRHRVGQEPGHLLLYLLGIVQMAVLVRMAVSVGYLAERHALFLVMLGMPWAAAGLLYIGDLLTGWLAGVAAWRIGLGGAALPAILAVAFVPATLKPLHGNRAGHRAAGEWLDTRLNRGDTIVDPFCWAHFYAGGIFREASAQPTIRPAVQYVILETGKNPHLHLPLLPIARNLAKGREPVYRWTPKPGQKDGAEEVVVYAIPLE